MKTPDKQEVRVGISYASFVPQLLNDCPGLVDYVEVPVEVLYRQRDLLSKLCDRTDVILHCASLSLAGNAPPSPGMAELIKSWIKESRTPWLGEHIAYLRMDDPARMLPQGSEEGITDSLSKSSGTDSSTYDVGYTVSPQFSPSVLERLGHNVSLYEDLFEVPVIVENGPIYFDMPGSAMTQWDFVSKLCRDFPTQKLLLDLAHLEITAFNGSLDPNSILSHIPLDRVSEIHIAGYTADADIAWDDHAIPARESTFQLLAQVCRLHKPKAVTLEYNSDPLFSREVIERDLGRTRDIVLKSSL
ncbi:MAG: DUF692 family multinuclear iron-containing protein [Rhodanobacter sp.]